MNPENNTQPQGSSLAIPIAIVIAGAFIAIAMYMSGARGPLPVSTDGTAPVALAPVTKDDHIIGNPDADVVFVEYSDLQCPFCKDFHATMERIMAEYGKTGKIAWVYRHFWTEVKDKTGKIVYHPLAGKAAEASECVAELGGNEKFWEYTGRLFKGQPESLTELNLSLNATAVGIDKTAFASCLSSGKYVAEVKKDYQEGRAAGVEGTPYTFIVTKDEIFPITGGALPYDQMRVIVEGVLK